MTEDDEQLLKQTLAKAVERIEMLEASNLALWNWVKQLASQDAMALSFAVHLLDRTDKGKAAREEITNTIFDNRDTLLGEDAPR
ncbi:hypothetical protein PARHAE_00730 [Paracoccus haematequi]|uniref:Uncharacterized protein n=1 Tax=Paracoccus haematequi TaxID=2491866 RepID=A0A3S4DUJ0_9RHOB|nr:hypothetical protein [Paracoccus haematequi]VDS07553.1 hypothetical protein PARHAE_00730 [Paracoccus haematequi]